MNDRKIYFAASVRGGRKNADIYREIIEYLKKYGTVFTECIGNKDVLIQEAEQPAEKIYAQCLGWLMQSDVIVAEVSTPSLGVGVEIDRAVVNNKNVLCLYRNGSVKKLSTMVSGCKKLYIAYYDDIEGAKAAIDFFLKLI